MKVYHRLCIETHSLCNRKCPTCLRQTHPANPRGKEVWVPTETILNILSQAEKLHPRGDVGFQWFCEPLLDPRIPWLAHYATERGFYVYVITNGNLLTPELAKQLDGICVHVSIYDHPKESDECKAYEKHLQSLFEKTVVNFSWGHITTHYSPNDNLNSLIAERVETPCLDLSRMFITSEGKMAFCCDDIACNWDLGNVYESTLEELWFSPKHRKIMEVLGKPGGRHAYPYCEICPRRWDGQEDPDG